MESGEGSNLKNRVKVRTGAGIDQSAIKRAEIALSELSVNFDGWAEEEIDRLITARDAVIEHGYSSDFAEALFRAAHDLKGEAVTFGYPMVTQISASLCGLLDAVGDGGEVPIDLVNHHVDAMRAIVRDRIKGEDNATAIALFNDLTAVTRTYVTSHGQPAGQPAPSPKS